MLFAGVMASHIVAILTTVTVLAAIPILAYVFLLILAIITNSGLGSPLLIIIVPVMSVLFALALTFVILVPSGLIFMELRRRRLVPWWSPPAVFFACGVVLQALMGMAQSAEIVAILMSAAITMTALTICFVFYWMILCAGLGGSKLVSAITRRLAIRISGFFQDSTPRDVEKKVLP